MTKRDELIALERALEYLDGDSPMHSRGGHRNEVLRVEIRQALASLEGDAVERVAGLLRKFHRDSCYPEAMAGELNAAVNAVLATGLVAGGAAVRADWHTTGWDRARNSGRILLVWSEFAGVREHIELGWYSDSKAAWVNTYGHPFHAEPDGWASLLPFKTAEAIKADEREKCARIAGSECYATTGRQIAAAIRSGGTNER